MSNAIDKLNERIVSGLNKLATVKAAVMLKEREEMDRMKDRERKLRVKRRVAYGDAVLDAGLDRWNPDEIVGLLLHALDDVGSSPTARLALRKRGEIVRAGQITEPTPSE